MAEFLYKIIPNVMDKQEDFFQAIWDTLVMAGWAGAFIIAFGLIVGVTLTVTRKDGIMQNTPLFQTIDKLVNLFRSIPFVILLASLMPLSRIIMGSAIGVNGAIVPLIIGAVPFYSRQVETALAEISPGKIEAALSMGCSPLGIIFRVYLRESIPSIARGTTITIISLFGLIAMAGAVGAGGLGDFAIRYGHDRNQEDVTYVTVIVMVIIVSIVQIIGNTIAKKTRH